MSRTANVLSVQTLKDFKLMMQLRRGGAQLARRRRHGAAPDARLARARPARVLAAQVKKRSEDLMQAGPTCTAARSRSKEATPSPTPSRRKPSARRPSGCGSPRRRWQLVKKLIPLLHHAIAEYHSHSQPLGDHLSGGFEKSVLGLEKMIGSLEAYLALRAPAAPRLDSAAGLRPGHDRRLVDHGETRDRQRRRPEPPAKPQAQPRQNPPRQPPRRSGRREHGLGEGFMSAHSGRLHHAIKHLREQWDIAQDTWDDPVVSRVREDHIIPLEQQRKNAITGMEKLSEVLGKDPWPV